MLYSEFGIFALIFAISTIFSRVDLYIANDGLVPYFVSYALHFYLMGILLRQYMMISLGQQQA